MWSNDGPVKSEGVEPFQCIQSMLSLVDCFQLHKFTSKEQSIWHTSVLGNTDNIYELYCAYCIMHVQALKLNLNMFTVGIFIEVTESAADPLLSVGWDTEVTLLYFIAVTENVLFPS